VPSTRQDEIVVGGLDVAEIPLKMTYSILGFVEKRLLLQYAVYRAASLFGVTCYAARKHEIRVGLNKDLQGLLLLATDEERTPGAATLRSYNFRISGSCRARMPSAKETL
jgi:hypothetical protein